MQSTSRLVILALPLGALWLAAQATAQPATSPPAPAPATYPALPGEIPPKFTLATGSFEYTRREEMIPMRDGVKLYTVILVPKGAKGAPILLTRTPYNAKDLTEHGH